jgi:hypothetical protein
MQIKLLCEGLILEISIVHDQRGYAALKANFSGLRVSCSKLGMVVTFAIALTPKGCLVTRTIRGSCFVTPASPFCRTIP